MSPKKYELFPFLAVMLFPVFVFLLSPSYLTESNLSLNRFMDDYLLGNGYYLPSNYPFAAKITNNFSVVFAVILALVWGILRLIHREGYYIPDKKQLWKYSVLILGLCAFCVYKSVLPQEFRVPQTRNWMLTESFHNIPVCFLYLMICKNTMIHYGIRLIFMFFQQERHQS